jgi:hypothetical protein
MLLKIARHQNEKQRTKRAAPAKRVFGGTLPGEFVACYARTGPPKFDRSLALEKHHDLAEKCCSESSADLRLRQYPSFEALRPFFAVHVHLTSDLSLHARSACGDERSDPPRTAHRRASHDHRHRRIRTLTRQSVCALSASLALVCMIDNAERGVLGLNDRAGSAV